MNYLCLLALLTTATAKILHVPINARSNSMMVMKRDAGNVPIHNKQVGYNAEIQVGQGDKVEVMIDSGSSDIWVGSSNQLSSAQDAGHAFKASYGIEDPTTVKGKFVKDDIKFGDFTSKGQQFAIVEGSTPPVTGVFGIAPQGSQNVEVKYTTFSQNLRDQGEIQRDAYAIYLNSLNESTGYITFGGFDKKKFIGALATIPMTTTSWFRVPGQMLNVSGTFHADLDTGSALCYLPKESLDELATFIGAKFDSAEGAYFFDEEPTQHIEFMIGGAQVIVPPKEYVTMSNNRMMLAMVPTEQGKNILGLPFMRSAYVLIDNDAKTISVAQSAFTTESNVKPLQALDASS